MTQDIIDAKAIHKTYDTGKLQVKALRGIDLVVKKGEMVGIMGPSGCGKTTMLNCLSGLDDLTGGSVLLEGKLLNTMSDDEKTRFRAQRMGFIFQFFNLLPVLSAVENVELPLLVGGVPPAEARTRALEMLSIVGLADQAYQKPAELSGGQQQRVTIARSLVNNPTIVWADEPTGNLDTETSKEIVDLLVRLNRENGQTFIVVTHDPKVGGRMTRLVWMESGNIVDDGLSTGSDVIKNNIGALVQENMNGIAGKLNGSGYGNGKGKGHNAPGAASAATDSAAGLEATEAAIPTTTNAAITPTAGATHAASATNNASAAPRTVTASVISLD